MWNVWRTVLEENEKLARARLAAVEVFQQQIADDAKVLRVQKLQITKKVSNLYFYILILFSYLKIHCFISYVFEYIVVYVMSVESYSHRSWIRSD